jgi:predicted amidohydrolase YtcJ
MTARATRRERHHPPDDEGRLSVRTVLLIALTVAAAVLMGKHPAVGSAAMGSLALYAVLDKLVK